MSAVDVPGALKDAYRQGFERMVRSADAGSEPKWLRERRTAAFARFVEAGLPSPRDEAWRHTPTAPLTRARFEPALSESTPDPQLVAMLPRPGAGSLQLVLVNGRFSRELSLLDGGPAGVEVLSLREALASRPGSLEPWLGRVADGETGAFALLNTALAADGAVVVIAPGAVVEQPIHVGHVGTGPSGTVAYSRTLVLAGRASQCRVVESFASPDARAALTNVASEYVLEDGAHVERSKLQQEGAAALHVATLAARLGRDARFLDRSLVLGAALARDDIEVRFEGAGGECALDGLFVVDGARVADTHSRIDHRQPHCSSRELYKGILAGQARGVFNGLVRVRPGAQKTDAWQVNRNLLLSNEALVHSTPQLEILADDVKCRHGSTTGQLEPAALFYLRSRGIGEAEARGLLTWAFAAELVDRLRDAPLREAVALRLRALGLAALPLEAAS